MTVKQTTIGEALNRQQTPTITNRFKLNRYTLESIRATYVQFVRSEIMKKGQTIETNPTMKRPAEEFTQWFSDFDKSGKSWFCFMGGVGSGKTTLMKAMFEFIKAIQLVDGGKCAFYAPFSVKYLTAVELATLYKEDPATINVLKNYQVIFIDDVGTEPKEIFSFGNVITPLVDIVSNRYNQNLALVFTTNMDGEAIKQRYGERIADRMRECCKFCVCNGKSMRKR